MSNLGEKTYNELSRITSNLVRLDEKLNDDEDSITYSDLVADSNPTAEDIYVKKELKRVLIKVFEDANLTEREKQVLILRFGLDGNEILKFKDIGDLMHIKKQRVDQIEKKALEKILRIENGPYSKHLRDFL